MFPIVSDLNTSHLTGETMSMYKVELKVTEIVEANSEKEAIDHVSQIGYKYDISQANKWEVEEYNDLHKTKKETK